MPLLLQSSPTFPIFFFFPSRTSTFLSSPQTLKPSRSLSLILHRRHALPLTDADLLAASYFDAVRSYENDLTSLTLVGAVSQDQALTAAAADGGDSAEEHLSSGNPAMVIETVYPGTLDDHSTVSTRLFLPANKVKEKAKKLRSSLTADILSSSTSFAKNILATTFRQVVLRSLWSFKLSFFYPGTERNMDDVTSPRKSTIDFTVSCSDKRFISALAEVVFSCALQSTARERLGRAAGSSSYDIFGWFQKAQWITSMDSSVYLCILSQDKIVKNAMSQVEKFNLAKGEVNRKKRVKHRWWPPPSYPSLDRAEGPEFSAWTNEFIPAYKLQIDGDTYKDANLEGWKRLDDNRWEVLLTHFQMVELANILDMYYEDPYTIPDKQLSCGLITETSNISRNKYSCWKMIFATIAGGCIIVFITVLAQVCWPPLLRAGRASKQSSFLSSSGTDSCLLQSPEATKLEALCESVVKKIKDELNWPGTITFDANIGAWTGILPTYLRDKDSISDNATSNGVSATNSVYDVQRHEELFVDAASPLGTNNIDMATTTHDITSYQVVLLGDGKIIGFQPTNRVAVNHWASNPLSKVLYEGQKLSPGLLEPRLKIPRPREVVLIELLMSLNPESYFALARAV